MTPNNDSAQIILTFADKETAEYVRLVCRRKGTDLESYILDNFEWDDQLECINDPPKKITVKTCDDCDFIETCPDAKRRS